MAADALALSSAAVPDLLTSDADFDQLPSTPALANGTEAEPVVIDDEDDDGDEHQDGIDFDQEDDDDDDDDDDYEILEDANGGAGQSNDGQDGVGARGGADDGTDADELAGEEDLLGLGMHSTVTHVDTEEEGGGEDDADAGEGPGEEFLPTVLIEFEDSLFDLFAQQAGDGKHDSEQNAIPLKAPTDILDQPLSSLFATLRIPDALGEFLEKDLALVLRSPEVDLEMTENDTTAEQVLLQDFLDIHPSNSNGDAVRLRFSQRQSFLTRFKMLGGVVNAAQMPAAPLSPTTAVSSWMSRAKSNSRRANGGDDEADELDDEAGGVDGGTLGEHHEPDDDDEGREPEWDEAEGEGEVNEHWEGEAEGEGEEEDEDEGEGEGEGDDDVILIEDDDDHEAGPGPDYEEGYEEGDQIVDTETNDHDLQEGGPDEDPDHRQTDEHAEEQDQDDEEGVDLDEGGEEGDEVYEDNEGVEGPSKTSGEKGPSLPATAESAPPLSAWKEPASSATNTVPTDGTAQVAPEQVDEGEYEDNASGDLVDRAGALGATSSLTGKRSFDETDDDLQQEEGDEGAKRLKV